MKPSKTSIVTLFAGLVAAQPDGYWARTVEELDEAATKQAQQLDTTATKVFTNTHIKAGRTYAQAPSTVRV